MRQRINVKQKMVVIYYLLLLYCDDRITVGSRKLSAPEQNGGVAMEVRFVTRNVELPADVKEYIEKKVGKLDKFFDKILYTQVALNFKRGMNVVEITSNVNGVVMRGEDYAADLRKAFDKALKNIER